MADVVVEQALMGSTDFYFKLRETLGVGGKEASVSETHWTRRGGDEGRLVVVPHARWNPPARGPRQARGSSSGGWFETDRSSRSVYLVEGFCTNWMLYPVASSFSALKPSARARSCPGWSSRSSAPIIRLILLLLTSRRSLPQRLKPLYAIQALAQPRARHRRGRFQVIQPSRAALRLRQAHERVVLRDRGCAILLSLLVRPCLSRKPRGWRGTPHGPSPDTLNDRVFIEFAFLGRTGGAASRASV